MERNFSFSFFFFFWFHLLFLPVRLTILAQLAQDSVITFSHFLCMLTSLEAQFTTNFNYIMFSAWLGKSDLFFFFKIVFYICKRKRSFYIHFSLLYSYFCFFDTAETVNTFKVVWVSGTSNWKPNSALPCQPWLLCFPAVIVLLL